MPPDVSIHEAAGQGDIEAVKQLLAAGADLNEKDEDFRWTPLQHAIMSGQLEVVRILIKYNSDLHVNDDHGCTALQAHATDHGSSDQRHGNEGCRQRHGYGESVLRRLRRVVATAPASFSVGRENLDKLS